VKRLAVALLATVLLGADLRIQVLTPFRMTTLVVEAPQVELGGQRLSLTRAVTLQGDASEISFQAGGQKLRGPRFTSKVPSVVLQLPDGTRRRYRGSLEVSVSNGVLQAVVTTTLEDAVAAASAAEMPSALAEARKAQEVAVRSYYTASAARHRGFDFCDTTHCQFLKDTAGDVSTRGLVLSYEGRPFGAMYFRNCGGQTRPAAAVGLQGSGYPYFGVECDVCRRDPERWKIELPVAAAGELLTGKRDENVRLQLARQFGWNSLRSNDYSVERVGEHVEVSGKGHGHGVGMCQRGAAAMAASGYDFTRILQHYYPRSAIQQRQMATDEHR
jgi:peptidoglycan hydrolase-like amidase